jgi:CRP/FNR family transcriptional regulator, cyclic AMP receptor protein
VIDIDALFAPLLRAPLFAGLTPAQLKTLALGCERATLEDGEALIVRGTPGDCAYLVVRGTVVRTEHPLAAAEPETFGVGTLVGEMAMLIETEHTSTIVARGKVSVLRLQRAMIEQLVVADPALGTHLADYVMGKVDAVLGGLKRMAAVLQLDEAMAAERQRDALH